MSDIDLVAALRGAVEAAQQRAESEQGNGREKGSISGPNLNQLRGPECYATPQHMVKLLWAARDVFIAELEKTQAERDQAEARIQRVRELHELHVHDPSAGVCLLPDGDSCDHCGDPYPCATILALDGGDDHA